MQVPSCQKYKNINDEAYHLMNTASLRQGLGAFPQDCPHIASYAAEQTCCVSALSSRILTFISAFSVGDEEKFSL